MSSRVFLILMVFGYSSLHCQVKISSTPLDPPHPSSMLEVESPDKGILPPRIADPTQIIDPSPGLMVYNTSINCMQYFNGTVWLCMGCSAPVLTGPIQGSTIPLAGSVQVYEVGLADNADSYQWSVPDGSSIQSGQGTSIISVITGTNSGPILVTAVNLCGSSNILSTLVVPFNCGVAAISINHTAGDGISPATKTALYGTVAHQSRCWTDRNLGADQVAVAANDNSLASGGWYWQFNRKQGIIHTGTNNNTPAWPGTSINESSDWLGQNDPCSLLLGASWRIPAASELLALESGWNSYNDAFSSPLKIHAGGRVFNSGNSDNARGLYGLYWSSGQNMSDTAHNIDIGPAFSYPAAWNKASGASLRCLRE